MPAAVSDQGPSGGSESADHAARGAHDHIIAGASPALPRKQRRLNTAFSLLLVYSLPSAGAFACGRSITSKIPPDCREIYAKCDGCHLLAVRRVIASAGTTPHMANMVYQQNMEAGT